MNTKILSLAFVLGLYGCATSSSPLALSDRPPSALSQASVSYPVSALASCASGFASVEFKIGTDGAISDAVVVESEPEGVFDEAALHAIRGMSWQPAVRNGRIIETLANQVVDFDVPPNCVPFDIDEPVDEAFDEDSARNACFESGGNRWDFALLQFFVGDDGYPTQIIVDEMSSPRMETLARRSLAKQQFDLEFVGQTLSQTMEHCSR